jgi:hypothetical protein
MQARGARWATALSAIRRERTVSTMSRVWARCSARSTIITASAYAWRREKYGRDHHNKATIYGLLFTAAADLLQRQLPAFVVQLFETVKLSRLYPVILQAWLILPSCLANPNNPTFAQMIFCSCVMS